MNTKSCFAPAHILLPSAQIPLEKWGCIACDQFTSDRDYWQKAEAAAAGSPSTLNLILPVFGLVFAIGSMIGIGSATRYNISTAKGSPSDYYFTQSIFWCLICSIPFMLTGIFIPHKALALLGADAGLIRLGRNYMRIVLLFTPFFMSNYTFTAFARNDHATSIAMIGSISGSFFNIQFSFQTQYNIFRSRQYIHQFKMLMHHTNAQL